VSSEGDAGSAEGDARPAGDAADDQAQPAPKTRDVASTAWAAIDAMRRGVIEYTTLAD
jgi:hypothetical protein